MRLSYRRDLPLLIPVMNSTERDIALELLSDAVRESHETVRLQVRGVCMHPLVQDGDWVQCRPIKSSPHPGQLVLAKDGRNQLVCHRILGRHNGNFRLAGDRTFAVEEHSVESILGHVISIERHDSVLDLGRPGQFSQWLDKAFAAWHLLSYRQRQQRIVGRVIEAVRWRLVVLRHRWIWWMG